MADSVMDVLLRARMEVSGVEAGVGQIQKSLKGLTLPKGVTTELEKSFGKLTPLLKDYQKQLNKGFSNKKDLQNFNALKEKISETFSEIRNQVQAVNSQEVRLKVDTQEIDKLENKITAKTADLQKALSNVFTKTVNSSSIKEQLDKVIGNTSKAATVKPMAQAAQALFNAQDYAAYNQKIDEIKNKILSLKTTKVDLATALGVKEANKNLDVANEKVKKFFDGLKVNEGKVQTIEHLKQELQELGIDLEKIKFDSLTNGANELQGIDNLIERLSGSLRETGNAASDAGQGMVRMVDEVNELKQSTQYFFSLRNMINLLKRGVDEAIQSVKELDAAMTETAVVTDFSVADMWKDLPKYTQIANELGATTQGAYETMTLYYQQGLNQQQAFALGAETMKMARIAGLDYAETTDMMTAALRGFNMELDETSAKRVNDVYSKLAAITASDTEELGTAMQRTASIAASAGASFEGTTAFLAQAIETTREPAENIGTAMKTIVARFQEMKKNPLEISEVDGEEVDYNKIDAALKTIGVDLKDTNGQFRNFDQVMLDISARWDGLSQAQQRYIATTAAGSRQQSRFIAMVSNYDRTMQLMEAANNSAGASDEQFGKTMDSLEAKLNKLHNAWQRFTMGIMNNNMVKGIVDAGTTILSVVNKIIDVLSFNGQSGLIKSVLSLATAFTALKGGGKIVNSLIGGLGGLVDPQSSFKEGLKGGFFGGREQLQADRISNPIVKAIYNLIPHIDKSATQNSQTSAFQKPGNYNGARSFLKTSGFLKDGISLKNVSDIFDAKQLNKEQQAAFLKASPGLRSMLSKQLGKIYEQAGASPETTRGMVAGFKKGVITLKDALAHEDLYESFSDKVSRMESAEANAFRESYRKQFEQEAKAQGVNVDEYKRQAFAALKFPKEGVEELMKALNERSPMEKFQDGLGQIGAGLMSAGSTLQMFGSTLSETNPILGQFVTGLGNTLTQMGSLINTIPALMNPWTLGIAAVGALIAVEEVRLNNIRTTAEEITKTFEETNKTTQDNIATLKSYKSELATLSKGVDINGNNVSLSDADYAHYLEIVDNIAQINPEIVQGYNAQGHAIIDNNNALSETLAKLEDIQKTTLDNYIDDDSLQKLIDARNINGTFRGATSKIVADKKASKWQEDQGLAGTTKVQTAPMTVAAQKVLAEMQKQKGLDINSILQGYNISLEQLQAGEEKAVNTFVKNQDQINAQVGAAIATSGEEINESLTKSFDFLSEQTTKFDEVVAPVLQNLQTYVSNNPAFKNIAPEFQSALMSGLKDIVIQPDLDATQMQDQARTLIQEFDNLSAEGSDYAEAMHQVEIAQNNFAESLDASQYTAETKDALATLDALMSHYAYQTDSYSQAIAEYLKTQKDKIQQFTTDSGVSLTQAFNGVSDTLAAAEGAYSAFQESTKTDLSTGKDSMKSIFDEITKETDGVALHMEKFGDGTMWKGARALLGDKFVEENADNVDKIKETIRSLEPELQAGEDGFAAFWNNFSQVNDKGIKGFKWNDDGSYSINRNINPDVYQQIADAMHRSEEYVVAMLNAGKQFADIDFHNIDDVRKAFATDEAAIKNGDKIFVKSDYYNNALDEANIYNPNERRNIKEQDREAGVIEIKNPDQITKDDFKSMGITDLASLIKTFGDTGLYNRDEIAEYAEALGKSGLIDYRPEDFAAGYQNYLDSQEHPEMQPIQSIDSTVQQIASLIAADQIRKGNFSQNDKKAADDFYKSVIGKAGKNDTFVQQFGEGKNEYGNDLTAKQYAENRERLIQARLFAEEQEKLYEQGAKAAEARGNDDTAAELRAAGQKYTDSIKSINANLTEGDAIWQASYAQQKAEEARQKALDNGMSVSQANLEAENVKAEALAKAQEITKALEDGTFEGLDVLDSTKIQKKANDLTEKLAKTGIFGNTDITNRPTIDWGAEPSKLGSKWDAAASYGWTEDQLRNSISTYMSSADTFKTLNGGAVSLTFTPIMENGEVIDASTMHNYLETLINEATNQNTGELDISKLMKLDQTGLEQFKSETGEQIHDVLMGAFEGEDAELMSGALGALEHYMEEGNLETATQAAKLIEDAVNGAEGAKEELAALIDSAEQFHESGPTYAPKTEAYTDTGTKGGISVTEFKSEGADKVKKDEKDIKDAADKGAEHETKFTSSGEKHVQQQLANMEKKSSTSVKVSSNTDDANAGISSVVANAANTVAKIPVGIEDKATPAARQVVSGISGMSATVKVNFAKTGISNFTISTSTDSIHGTITASAAGRNNKINSTSVPTFGSAAKGKSGTIGPKNNGGLTLTGEEGFEIAWLPDENRSTILGVGGPQMVNLPSNAVIYTHQQSKEILKRKGIPAGSMDRGKYTPTPTSTPSTTTTTSYTAAVIKAAKKAGDKVSRTAEDTSKAIARVTVWWENAARRAEAIQRRIDKNQDKYEDYLKKAYITLTQIGKKGGGNAFVANNISYTKEQQRQYDKASQELKQLYSGRWQAGKYKGKKAKGKKAYLRGADNVIEVSYGKDKKVYENTAKYIKYDKKSGSYQIDQKAINKIKNRERRKATAEQINKELNDRISKRNTALDNINKAKEALDKFSQELYDTFFGWEISLTKIWNITQKIEAAQARISSLDAGNSLLKAQLSSGSREGNEDTAKFDLSLFQKKLDQQNQVLQLRQEAIDQAQQDVKTAVKTDDAQILKEVKKTLKDKGLSKATRLAYEKYAEQLQDNIKVTTKAQKYLTTTQNADGTVNINFNAAQLESDKLNATITADEAKAIEEYKNSIEEANKNLNEQRQSLIEGVTDYYNTLADLKDQWADYESQLIQINEESNKKELENLKKLSDTVKKSLDDLLDSVKKQLDERRKQEDNAKTERSISQKQQRLAMLRADTSGGHQVEIAQLEKEIADAQTDYQRSLEDQLLEKLQNQADEAAKQRERQIELQEELASSVNNIALVDMWMSNPKEYREEILQAYRTANDYDKTGIYGQQKIDRQFESFYEGLLTNQTKQSNVSTAIEDANAALKSIKDYLKRIDININNAKSKGIGVKEAHNDYFEGTSYKNLAKNGKYTVDDFAKDKIAYQTARSAFSAEELQKNSYYKAQAAAEIEENRQKAAVQKRESKLNDAQGKVTAVQKQLSSTKDPTEKRRLFQLYALANKNLTSVKYQNFLEARGSKQNSGDKNWGKLGKDGYIAQVERGEALGYSEKKVATDLANTDKLTWQQVIKAAYQAGRSGTTIKNWYPNAKETGNFRKAFDKIFTKGWAKYAQGGLADFTGPAWLDGTPSKPELVLNASDTRNFLALRDVLSKALGATSSVTNSYGGDATYEININVDKIEKDYDVDKVAERVKKIIVKDSGYRNVTQVRNFR